MAILNVIEYEGPNDVLVWKHPAENFNTKSQLIVHESQEAILFKDGQALDLFGSGAHTLETKNVPLLRKIINLPFGGVSPFRCEVYFINKVHSLDVKWGTSTPIPIQDPTYKIILPVRANGQFGVQVEDSRKLLVKLVGTVRSFTQQDIIRCFRGLLISNIKDYIAKRMAVDKITFLEIHAHLSELSDGVGQELQETFLEYGIRLVNFYISAISVPEDDPSYLKLKESLSKKAEMDLLGYTYQQERTFDVLQNAAQNEGSGNATMGAGMGLGMGVNLGSFVGQSMGQSIGAINTPSGGAAATCNCVNCGAQIAQNAKFCPNCGAEQIQPGMVKCASCGQIMPQGKFCGNCGAALQQLCPNCGTPVSGNFCPNCGKKWRNDL